MLITFALVQIETMTQMVSSVHKSFEVGIMKESLFCIERFTLNKTVAGAGSVLINYLKHFL